MNSGFRKVIEQHTARAIRLSEKIEEMADEKHHKYTFGARKAMQKEVDFHTESADRIAEVALRGMPIRNGLVDAGI